MKRAESKVLLLLAPPHRSPGSPTPQRSLVPFLNLSISTNSSRLGVSILAFGEFLFYFCFHMECMFMLVLFFAHLPSSSLAHTKSITVCVCVCVCVCVYDVLHPKHLRLHACIQRHEDQESSFSNSGENLRKRTKNEKETRSEKRKRNVLRNRLEGSWKGRIMR